MTTAMSKSSTSRNRRRVSTVQVALERLADAQEATQAELHDLVTQVRHLTEAQQRTEERVGRLEATVERLAEAQQRTEERVGRLEATVERLAEAQRRTEERLEALAQAQQRTEERLEALAQAQQRTEERLEELAQAQRRTEERLEALAQAQQRTEEHLAVMTTRMNRMDGQLGNLTGWVLEHRYRDRAPAYFDDLLSGIRVLSHQEIALLLEPAFASGAITRAERRDAIDADIVLHGKRLADSADAYLVAEVSASVSAVDAERAARRSGVVARATGAPVIAAVVGPRIHPDADLAARKAGLWRVLDGTTLAPTELAPAGLLAAEEQPAV